MSLTLYWNIISQPCRAVKCLLLAGGVEHEDKHLDIMAAEHRKEEYIALNPNVALPFITLNGKTMNESGAILRYLA